MDEDKKKTLLLFGGESSDGSDRLAVKSEALAKYFGKQFIDIWSDYVVLPRKDYK